MSIQKPQYIEILQRIILYIAKIKIFIKVVEMKISTENQIKEYLKQNGISQVHIAKAIGMPEPILSMTLNGKRRLMLEEYALICGVLKVNTDFFLKPRLPDAEK